MRSQDERRTEPARAGQTEDRRAPGKRTLVEGLDPANEAAKGDADKNPKLGAGGGEAAGADAQEARAHDADATDGAGPEGAPHPGGANRAGGAARPARKGAAEAAGPANAASSGETGAAPAADGAAPASTSDAASGREAKAESWITAVFGGSARGAAAQAQRTAASESTSAREAKQQTVKPMASPTFHGSAGANNCLPGDATGASITWTVVAGATTWGVSVASFTTTGTINVAPWPSKPTEMVTPNTANPVDGGNIENKSGSNNDWKFAIKEMQEYNQSGGGRSSYWHSYEASRAHEWEHWNTDWLKGIVEPSWPAVNADLDAIKIPKADAADEAAARPLLQAKIDARMKTFDRELTRKWNAVPDSPGEAGANGYIAGQKILDKLIAAVQAYGKAKGW